MKFFFNLINLIKYTFYITYTLHILQNANSIHDNQRLNKCVLQTNFNYKKALRVLLLNYLCRLSTVKL